MLLSSPFLLSLALRSRAAYDDFFFVMNGNHTATCPGLEFGCNAHDRVIDKYYCCSGEDYPICRAFADECSGNDGGPSSLQVQCEDSGYTWCCLSDREQCTQRSGESKPDLED